MLNCLSGRAATAILLGALITGFGHAQPAIPGGYQKIAGQEGVPDDIWFALLQQESCIPVQDADFCLPWLWTLNIDNKGYFFRDRGSAEFALSHAVLSHSLIAIGPGQIYWPAHYDQFTKPSELLDAETNLRYSAQFLKSKFLKTGDWWVSVGLYHAPNDPQAATEYRRLVYKRWLARQ